MQHPGAGSLRAAAAALGVRLPPGGVQPADGLHRAVRLGRLGGAQLPGRLSWVRFRSPGMATLVHELGHNLGLEHAYGLVCRQGDRRVALSDHCRPVEYGDSWDAMGHSQRSSPLPDLRPPRLGRSQSDMSPRPGTSTLADVAHAHAADQALRVRRRAHDVLGGVPAPAQPRGRPHAPRGDDPPPGRARPGRDDRRLSRQPDRASPTPDRDLTNPALPAGSSLTTPHGIRFTTLPTGRASRVEIAFHQPPQSPDTADDLTPSRPPVRLPHAAGRRPSDNGQIVLGYRRRPPGRAGRRRFVRRSRRIPHLAGLPPVETGWRRRRRSPSRRSTRSGWSAAGDGGDARRRRAERDADVAVRCGRRSRRDVRGRPSPALPRCVGGHAVGPGVGGDRLGRLHGSARNRALHAALRRRASRALGLAAADGAREGHPGRRHEHHDPGAARRAEWAHGPVERQGRNRSEAT